jgi:hypothetical protein
VPFNSAGAGRFIIGGGSAPRQASDLATLPPCARLPAEIFTILTSHPFFQSGVFAKQFVKLHLAVFSFQE